MSKLSRLLHLPFVPVRMHRRSGIQTLQPPQYLPAWRQTENTYILRGYQPITSSYFRCIGSLVYLHNETVKNLHARAWPFILQAHSVLVSTHLASSLPASDIRRRSRSYFGFHRTLHLPKPFIRVSRVPQSQYGTSTSNGWCWNSSAFFV